MLATSLSRSSRSPRNSRCSMTLIAESGVRARVSASEALAHARGSRRPAPRRSLAPGVHAGIRGEKVRTPSDRATTGRRRGGPFRGAWPSESEAAPRRTAQRPSRQLGRRHQQGARHPGRPSRPALQHRQVAKGRIAAEQFVSARARQRHGEAGGADRLRHVVGVQSIEGRLVEAVQRSLQILDEVPLFSTTSWCWVPMAAAIRLATALR